MSTVAIYNGFGKYEIDEKGVNGITLMYAGVPFWFPYKRITYLPDFTFREVDHNASTPEQGEEGFLTYRTHRVSGERLAEELLDKQEPVPNKDKGLLKLEKPRPKGGAPVNVYAGITEDGTILTAEVNEVLVSDADVARAEKLAQEYKEQVIQEYFQSKRERLAGGHGPLVPRGFTKIFMTELGVKDIDALPTQSQNSNLEQLFTQFLATLAAGQTKIAVPATPGPAPKSTATKDIV